MDGRMLSSPIASDRQEDKMSATAGQLDTAALRRAIESRDAATQAAMFAPDAEVVMVDKDHPPSDPLHVAGTDAIRAMLDDVCSRDMTHEVTHMVSDPSSAAYTVACRYADGTRVFCAVMLDVQGGRITREEGVQAWDDA
jgi:hypothetical protein